jgi:hypothetical protein
MKSSKINNRNIEIENNRNEMKSVKAAGGQRHEM